MSTHELILSLTISLLPVMVAAQPPQGPLPGQPGGRGGQGPGAAYPTRVVDPATAERGRAIYSVNCAFCHGQDTRGGDSGPSILYLSTPDNAWAIDARDGRELWHYYWKTKGGTHIGNRGLGMWRNHLFMETPDNYLVSLDARTGKERWHKVISSFEQQYYSTMAPIVVDNHVLVGTGNDLDAPGFLQSFDPETGELQWKLYTVPMNEGDPGLETWKNLDAARHGGAQPVRDPKKDHDIAGALVSAANGGAVNWPPPSFSPDTGLFYVPVSESWAMYYLTETDPRGAMGLGGKEEVGLGGETFLTAIDYKTGKIAWRQKYPSVGGGGGGSGVLTTAGRLLFAADAGGNIVARDVATGNPLWHAHIGSQSNAPQTYMIDGRQHLLVTAGDMLYAFALYDPK